LGETGKNGGGLSGIIDGARAAAVCEKFTFSKTGAVLVIY